MRIELSEDEVLFFVELLALAHLARLTGRLHTQPGTPQAFAVESLGEMAKEPLRSLVREPLKDPEFRKQFNEHFSKHPSPGIRGEGFDWLQEQLTFES